MERIMNENSFFLLFNLINPNTNRAAYILKKM